MKILYYMLSLMVLAASFAWLYHEPGWDSGVATLAAVAAVIGVHFATRDSARAAQSQSVSNGSIGIQAGRDASTGAVNVRGKGRADGN